MQVSTSAFAICCLFSLGAGSPFLFGGEIPVGTTQPANRSEVSEVGRSTATSQVTFGSPEFNAFDLSGNPAIVYGLPDGNGNPRGSSEAKRMLFNLRMKLDELAVKVQALGVTPAVRLRVLRAWVDPAANSVRDDGDSIHSEGRALDIRIEDQAGVGKDELLAKVAGLAFDEAKFDWVSHHREAKDDPGTPIVEPSYPAHIHVSIRVPTDRMLVSSGILLQSQDDIKTEASNSLRKLLDSTAPEILDGFIAKYRETDSGKAAMAVRYALLRTSDEATNRVGGADFLKTYAEGSERSKTLADYTETTTPKRSQLEALANNLCNAYNTFITAHVGTSGAYVASLELLQLRQFQNEPRGYLDFISRYPTLPETQLAIDSLYQVEAMAVMLSDLPNPVAECDRFLENYPLAMQWTVVSAYATRLEVDRHTTFSVSRAERGQAAQRLLGNAVSLYQELRKLRKPLPASGEADDGASIAETYVNLGRARFLLDQINRIERVLDANYRSSDSYRELFRLQLQWEINDKLRRITRQFREINESINITHAELITELRTQFDATRDEVKKGFRAISDQIAAGNAELAARITGLETQLDRHFADLSDNLTVLHRDMIVCNNRLAEVVQNTRDTKSAVAGISVQLRSTERRITQLVFETDKVASAINQLDRNLSNEVGALKNEISSVAGESTGINIDLGQIQNSRHTPFDSRSFAISPGRNFPENLSGCWE